MVDFQDISIGTSGTPKPAVLCIGRVPALVGKCEEEPQRLVILQRRLAAQPVASPQTGPMRLRKVLSRFLLPHCPTFDITSISCSSIMPVPSSFKYLPTRVLAGLAETHTL